MTKPSFHTADLATLETWLCGKLRPFYAEKLARWVRAPGPWRDAYLESLRPFLGVWVPAVLDVRRSVNVATDWSEIEHAKLLRSVPLPHLGAGVELEVRHHVDGTAWRMVGAADDRALVVRCGTARVVWPDPVLGVLVFEVDETPTPDHEGFTRSDVVISMIRLSDGLDHPRALQIARTVAEEFRSGAMLETVAAGARALDGADLDFDTEPLTSAVMVWLELHRLADRLCDDDLDAVLAAADAALLPHGRAMLLFDGRSYQDLTLGFDVDAASWVGLPVLLDEAVPERMVTDAWPE